MENSSQKDILDYFTLKAKAYDDVDKQVYWQLSDALLWTALKELCLKSLTSDFLFLDAGGGTGRWSEKILQSFPDARGTIRDISAPMLAQARLRQDIYGADRLSIVQGSIEQMHDISNGQFDLVFNFHNVIGFLTDPAHALTEMSRVLKPGGWLITVAPNLYHMAFFNIQIGQLEIASQTIKTSVGKFTPDMPPLKVFTPETLREMYSDAGMQHIRVFGFPKLIFPGFQETQLEGDSLNHAQLLQSVENMRTIMAMEQDLLYDERASARGNNLLVVGQSATPVGGAPFSSDEI